LQVIIALLAIVLLIAVMGYVAFSVTTVQVPDFGGTYIEGIAGNPNAINPILCQSNPVDQDLAALIFTGLTRVSDTGEIVPDRVGRSHETARSIRFICVKTSSGMMARLSPPRMSSLQ